MSRRVENRDSLINAPLALKVFRGRGDPNGNLRKLGSSHKRVRIDLPVPCRSPAPTPHPLPLFSFIFPLENHPHHPPERDPKPCPRHTNRNSHLFATTTPGTNYPLVSARRFANQFGKKRGAFCLESARLPFTFPMAKPKRWF